MALRYWKWDDRSVKIPTVTTSIDDPHPPIRVPVVDGEIRCLPYYNPIITM